MLDKTLWKLSETEYLMGRDKLAPLTPQMRLNMETLLVATNLIRDLYGKPMIVTSGYRPPEANAAANGKPQSAHLTCEACDFRDDDGQLAQWCIRNLDLLQRAGLYMESPTSTRTPTGGGWVHLQTRAPKSGKRVFIP